MKLKCCLCENFLAQRKPVRAYLSIAGRDSVEIPKATIEFDAGLRVLNLQQLRQKFAEEDKNKAIQIHFQKPLKGSLADFTIAHYILNYGVASLEVRCGNCKYNSNYLL